MDRAAPCVRRSGTGADPPGSSIGVGRSQASFAQVAQSARRSAARTSPEAELLRWPCEADRCLIEREELL